MNLIIFRAVIILNQNKLTDYVRWLATNCCWEGSRFSFPTAAAAAAEVVKLRYVP